MSQFPNALSNFKASFKGGTRPNRFRLTLTTPNGNVDTVLVRAASLPSSDITPIPVGYRGRILKVPGDRVYAPWTFTVLDESVGEGGGVWKRLHDWSNEINNHATNNYGNLDQSTTVGGEGSLFQPWLLEHLANDGSNPIKKMSLKGCWPSSVGPVEFNAGVTDQLVEFSCTVEYEHFEILTNNSTNSGAGGGDGSPGGAADGLPGGGFPLA